MDPHSEIDIRHKRINNDFLQIQTLRVSTDAVGMGDRRKSTDTDDGNVDDSRGNDRQHLLSYECGDGEVGFERKSGNMSRGINAAKQPKIMAKITVGRMRDGIVTIER